MIVSITKNLICLICISVVLSLCYPSSLDAQKSSGFFDYEWIDSTGQLMLVVPKDRIGEDFLYVNSLSAGLGSNDIGLDRGQLGSDRVVYFYKSGNKLLLTQRNLDYRAVSDNPDEVRAVKDAFAESILWGFKIASTNGTRYQIDMTPFLLRDAHGVSSTLASKKQGAFKLDKDRSALYPEGTMNFPMNTEFESILTFAGKAEGAYVKSVTPDPSSITLRQHHSFIALPDDEYEERVFHPESGFFFNSFYDYATPIVDDLRKRYIVRHRLEKKDPTAASSEAVEPIIYYLDPGCPEPVRSALIEGASWWNQAFEAAGYIDAFQVKDLPEGAHMLDVRYNVIQWVHRSTRGWSYGASVADPRTGEIIKGHVSLGSLRVRQDFLIAQGIISRFDESSDDPRMLQMAIARLRQLSAHEVGHTIGLAHNFAASANDRASVMDYPHPYIVMDGDEVDLTDAYAVGIGEWDKRAITYGYGTPPQGSSEEAYLTSLIKTNHQDGLLFITDQDARPTGGAHPYAHLWDNGNDPVEELTRIINLRREVLDKLGTGSIPDDRPLSEIEKVLVPAYLMHRYQVEAAAKLIGGVDYSYAYKNEERELGNLPIPHEQQNAAITSILSTLTPEFLELPSELIDLIPPPAYGYPRTRESFKSHTGMVLDPLAAAESSVDHSLSLLLQHQRLSRILRQSTKLSSSSQTKGTKNPDRHIKLHDYLKDIHKHINPTGTNTEYHRMMEKVFCIHLLKVGMDKKVDKQVSGICYDYIQTHILKQAPSSSPDRAHLAYLEKLMLDAKTNPEKFQLPEVVKMPPGSPIGCH